MGVRVTIDDQVTPVLRKMLVIMTKRSAMAEIAAAVGQVVKRHLIQKNKEPNKKGWPKTGFYGKAAEKTNWQATDSKAIVAISQEGFGQRYHGGPITAKKAGALTIPLSSKAYGHRAREFKNLILIKTSGGKAILFEKGTAKVSRTGKNGKQHVVWKLGTPMFLLVKAVDQKGDKTVIPPPEAMNAAALKACLARYKREIVRLARQAAAGGARRAQSLSAPS